MDKLVTVLTAGNSLELEFIKEHLQAEGNYCFLKDNAFGQSGRGFAEYMGRIKLQVKRSDLREAVKILAYYGYDLDRRQHGVKTWEKVVTTTARLPIVGRIPFTTRLILLLLSIILISSVIVTWPVAA